MHELYHVINDFDILENLLYHISDSENPELLLNEERADKFALDALVNPTIQKELSRIVALPYKMNQLANKLNVDVSILYGIYLETLPKGEKKNKEFAKYGGMLKSSDIAVRRVEFDAVPKHSLNGAIDKMKKNYFVYLSKYLNYGTFKKKLEDLISAVDKIVAANSQQEPSLFDELSAPTDIAKILDVPIQDPENLTIYIMGIFKSF